MINQYNFNSLIKQLGNKRNNASIVYYYHIIIYIMKVIILLQESMECKDYINTFKLLERSANEEYLEAINTLGCWYEDGDETKPNPMKAAGLYFKATKRGCRLSPLILIELVTYFWTIKL